MRSYYLFILLAFLVCHYEQNMQSDGSESSHTKKPASCIRNPPRITDKDLETSKELQCYVNAARNEKKLPPLYLSKLLSGLAYEQSKHQTVYGISHNGTNNITFSERIKSVNVKYSYAAENVAKGQKSVEQVMFSWIESCGHRKNIMSKEINYLGAGSDGVSWTQDFLGSFGPKEKRLEVVDTDCSKYTISGKFRNAVHGYCKMG